MGAAARRAPACLTLFLLPVFLPLLLLWLPLLCVVVAAVRFRRRRRRMVRGSRCLGDDGEREAEEDAGHRASLLHKYLEDQMRLVGVDATVDYWRPSSCSQQGHAQQRLQSGSIGGGGLGNADKTPRQ